MTNATNTFGARATLTAGGQSLTIYRLDALDRARVGHVSRLPFSLRVLLENLLRYEDGINVTRADIEAVANWNGEQGKEIAFTPARVLMQDFTGVPAVVDLAAMRDAIAALGGDPQRINPLQPADLVIDHSVQVDQFGSARAMRVNTELENERNRERYQFLKWGQSAFKDFTVVPPATGIVHQVNLEYIAKVLFTAKKEGELVAYPDTLVGTDSHTTMINGLGVVGWGVGGIEAEAAMLGQPITMLIPQVTGFKLVGKLPEGATATDLVLTVTEMLRAHGVVGRFVEFYGPGMRNLSLPDRATIANMCPEYGATIGFFPVDEETLRFLRFSGRDEALVEQVEAYYREQGLFLTDETPEPIFTDTLELDLSTVVPSLSGPRLPQQRVPLTQSKPSWRKALIKMLSDELADVPQQQLAGWAEASDPSLPTPEGALARGTDIDYANQRVRMTHGKVVIAAITSCTNTSNPSVMIAAGLLARKAVEAGLDRKPWVKTSLAPGSRVVSAYLERAGLVPYLDALGFHTVGFGCTTCIGNSGPLPEPIDQAIASQDLVVCSVLSGNRNFEGRIGPSVRANYLASPPLVVAYALAGTLDIDVYNEPLGHDPNGEPVYLRDIWPSNQEIADAVGSSLSPEQYRERYADVYAGDEIWRSIDVPGGDRFAWDPDSTYVRQPPYFEGMTREPAPIREITGARLLALLGDAVTTDHISPAGSIAKNSPAAQYLTNHGIERKDFNSYGSRRGNHEVMMRGTFANVRLRNQLAPGTEGGWTKKDGEVKTIYDAAMEYRKEGTPLVVVAGELYGSGSSRDWAAKGPALLGVRVVIARSYERIHRSNLIGMGILPLQFKDGETLATYGLDGTETFDILGLDDSLKPGQTITVKAGDTTFETIARIDTPVEVEYYRHGGILHYVLRNLAAS